MMKGDLWVQSPVDGNSEPVILPSAGSAPRSPEQPGTVFHFTAWFGKAVGKKINRVSPATLAGNKILIVDDNRANLDILTHILISAGMPVVALADGADVIPTLQKALKDLDPFALCVMDIQMPKMSGYEVAEQIRSSKQRIRQIPLIALSSLLERDAKKCEATGFNGFLNKPIRREKLYQMMERLLGEKKKGDEKGRAEKKKIITQYSVREDMKHSVRILLAEDNPVNQKLATIILKKAGYQVVVANNGREAVEKIAGSPDDFDLIFMDIQMPEMDGIEATKEIRRFERRNQLSLDNQQSSSPKLDRRIALTINNQQSTIPKIPIVAMTAHALKGDMEICLQAGMDDYMTKPIKREIVFEIIKKWVFNKERS